MGHRNGNESLHPGLHRESRARYAEADAHEVTARIDARGVLGFLWTVRTRSPWSSFITFVSFVSVVSPMSVVSLCALVHKKGDFRGKAKLVCLLRADHTL